jgi:hypothetical protein
MAETKEESIDRLVHEMKSQFTPSDLMCLILVEAGYEETPMPFDLVELERLLYKNQDRLPTLAKNYVYFKTNGTFPDSPYIERAYHMLLMSGVFKSLNQMKLANGTREYHANDEAQPDPMEMEVIKEIGQKLREKMTGEKHG